MMPVRVEIAEDGTRYIPFSNGPSIELPPGVEPWDMGLERPPIATLHLWSNGHRVEPRVDLTSDQIDNILRRMPAALRIVADAIENDIAQWEARGNALPDEKATS